MENEKPILDKRDFSLEYKQHEYFFQLLYKYIEEYHTNYAFALTEDITKVTNAITSLNKIISLCSAHLSKKKDIIEFHKEIKLIFSYLKDKQINKTLSELEKLTAEVFNILESEEIIPKVKIYEDDMDEFWKNEEHAGVKEMKKAFYDILILN